MRSATPTRPGTAGTWRPSRRVVARRSSASGRGRCSQHHQVGGQLPGRARARRARSPAPADQRPPHLLPAARARDHGARDPGHDGRTNAARPRRGAPGATAPPRRPAGAVPQAHHRRLARRGAARARARRAAGRSSRASSPRAPRRRRASSRTSCSICCCAPASSIHSSMRRCTSPAAGSSRTSAGPSNGWSSRPTAPTTTIRSNAPPTANASASSRPTATASPRHLGAGDRPPCRDPAAPRRRRRTASETIDRAEPD